MTCLLGVQTRLGCTILCFVRSSVVIINAMISIPSCSSSGEAFFEKTLTVNTSAMRAPFTSCTA